MRCPDCNKFRATEPQDPEEENATQDCGVIAITVRLVLACIECGAEMKQATLEMENDHSAEAEDHLEDCKAFQARIAADEDPEATPEQKAKAKLEYDVWKDADIDVSVDGVNQAEKGSGSKVRYGATVSYTLCCNDCNEDFCSGEIEDTVAPTEFDEC